MTVVIRHLVNAIVLLPLLWTNLLAQSGNPPPTQSTTFHVHGTIADPTEAVIPGISVTFTSQETKTTVATTQRGLYEADLPLGVYQMTVSSFGRYRGSHRDGRRGRVVPAVYCQKYQLIYNAPMVKLLWH